MSSSLLTIAVVICTRDRPADLIRCLVSIASQSVFPDQVIVVSGSEDSCPAGVVDDFKFKDLIVIDCFEHNISKSRNVGLHAAHTDVVLFIDDDAIARDGWMLAFQQAFEHHPECWAVGGDVFDSRTVPPSAEFSFGFVSPTGRQHPVRAERAPVPRGYLPTVKGCNFGIRRVLVNGLGGFDPFFAFAFDEADLMLSIQEHGGAVVHESTAIVDHAHTPGHYRQTSRFDRDWRVEYASHTRFMLKHTRASMQRLHGWAVISGRLAKLVAMGGGGVLGSGVRLSCFIRMISGAIRGIGDAVTHSEYAHADDPASGR
jgi:GT2 family glycosyltransferase